MSLSARDKLSAGLKRGPLKSSSLAAEAADMEAKLAELRKAMEVERAKREMKVPEGGFWRSAAPAGSLRSTSRSKLVSPLPPLSAGNNGSDTSQTSSSSQLDAQRWVPPESLPAPGRPPMHRPDSGSQGNMWRTSALPPAKPLLSRPSHGAVPQQSAQHTHQTDDERLGDGTFNESESHSSFLDALNEWRAANRAARAPATQQPQQQHAPPSARHTQLASAQEGQQGQSFAVQTEAPPRDPATAARPASGKPVTYFDRLVLNTAARQAGHAATGSNSNSQVPTDTTTLPALPGPSRKSSYSILPLPHSPSKESSSQVVYAVESAMTETATNSQASTAPRHRGLDILEELEALERKREDHIRHYDSDEEFAALLSPWQGTRGRVGDKSEELIVETHTGLVGVTRADRLPDSIVLPEIESDQEH